MRALALAALIAWGGAAQAQEPAPIQDNSFLIEEAYNQEKRVVQHINAFFHAKGGWWYTFTQEWPAGGQRSQLSYTVPLYDGGFGDLALNYRMQIVARERLSVAPRFSVLLPTGKWEEGRGNGAVGLQFNLPVSARIGPRLVTHWNAGITMTPSAPSLGGERSTIWGLNAGASAIYEVGHNFNVLVEVAWTRVDDIFGPGFDFSEMFVNPGIRWAHNLPGGLQIVPGIGVPIGVLEPTKVTAVFFYLSFEHDF